MEEEIHAMTETDRLTFLQHCFEHTLRQDLGSPSAQRVKPSYAVCAEMLEGSMERPGIDTKPFSYHIKNGRAFAGPKPLYR